MITLQEEPAALAVQVRELIDPLVLRLRELNMHVRNVHVEDVVDLFVLDPINVLDGYRSDEPVDGARKFLVKIDATADPKKDVYQAEGKFAEFIKKFIMTTNMNMDGAGNMSKTHAIEITVYETELEDLANFLKDPEYHAYSKEFDQLMEDLLSKR